MTHLRHYLPVVRALFAHWPGACACARPLAWRIWPGGGTSEAVQLTRWRQMQPVLPLQSQVRITRYGAAELRVSGIQRDCQTHHWHLGLKADSLFRQGPTTWRALAAMPLHQGEQHYLRAVHLTQQRDCGPVHLVADWTQTHETPHYFVSDQPTERRTWRRGRKRCWLAPCCRAGQRAGFDLIRSQSAAPDRQRH